jgi:Calcium binding
MTIRRSAPMSWEEDERRVAEILGVHAGQRLPAVSRQTLRQYHTYLTAHLVFPFQAVIEDLDGVITIRSLFKLKECPDLTFYGLFVRGNQGQRLIEIPIATIEEVKEEGTNKQLIEDYCMWFWNYR